MDDDEFIARGKRQANEPLQQPKPRSPHLKLDGDFSVNPSLNFSPLGGDERGSEFGVMIVEEILAADSQFPMLVWAPPQPHIESPITFDIEGRELELIHITGG